MKAKKSLISDSVPIEIPKRPGKKNKVLFFAIFAALIVAFGSTAYFYIKYNDLKNDPNAEAKEDTVKLVREVGKIMLLPADETPTVATISDKEKLKDQTFFAKAEDGDKLLAYGGKYMQAILYRPSIHKIINVAPIVSDGQEAVKQQSSEQPAAEGSEGN